MEFKLHRAVFENNIAGVVQLLRKSECDINQQDVHGNTALHLAVMLGRKDVVHIMVDYDAQVKMKNMLGWTPLAEAISYGNREVIITLLRKLKDQSRQAVEEKRPALVSMLKSLRDFTVSLRWEFHSWVPLVSKILPSDVCQIRKRGSSIRMDTTLVDFNDMRWVRGDITFLFDGCKRPHESLYVLDNKLKVYQRVRNEESELELGEEADLLMSNDIVSASLSTKHIVFERAQAGWWLFREAKSAVYGDYVVDIYTAHGIFLESRKRREHLSKEDISKNKEILSNLARGMMTAHPDMPFRESLKPPPASDCSWDAYMSAPPGQPPCLARPITLKCNSKHFSATLGLCEDFPMKINDLLAVLEVIAPFKHFHKLREFMLTKLPPGFPVRLEIPVFPTITARVTFEDFAFVDQLPPEQFVIPTDYREDATRFPDL